jgi:uncharacterized membrane protein YfcA
VAIAFAASASVAAVAGSRLRGRVSNRRLTQLFAGLVVVVAVLLIVESVRPLI